MITNNFSSATIGWVAIAAGIAGLLDLVFIILFFTVGQPFGTLNDICIGLTAILFSLKHALVDASLGRLLALIAFGVICGVVAQRDSWRRSAALHMVLNTIATIIGLLAGPI